MLSHCLSTQLSMMLLLKCNQLCLTLEIALDLKELKINMYNMTLKYEFRALSISLVLQRHSRATKKVLSALNA